ncbi:hypothetical protein AgCh_004504 [Apium graveolens]
MVQEVVVNYFENLSTASTNTYEILQAREEVQCVTDEQNDMLLQAVTTEEVRAAVFFMHSEKSPGPDGLNPGFFQAFWGVVGTDLMNFCQHFLNTGELPEVVNHTLVCLILKVKNPKQMTDFRPISLCNVLVRIVSKRLMTYVRMVKYSFVNNGKVFGDVRPHREIRQGDPISPYIYILCAEGLSTMLRRKEEEGHIHGISIARGAPKISHLLFADDCYLFFNATGEEARNMKNILSRYEMFSGQAISLAKSSITFSPNIRERE